MKAILLSMLVLMGSSVEWLTDLQTAKETAAKEHKDILLNFSGSDWCAPCIKLKKEVFESESFGSIAGEKLVLVRADFPRSKKNQLPRDQMARNEALAEKYNPEGKFPLTLLLDQDGNVVKSWDGYAFATQDKFIADLRATLASR